MNAKKEQISEIQARYQKSFDEIDKRREYRMENYYNCVDDYSFGGICDKADNEYENKLRYCMALEIESVENDGYIYRTFKHSVLTDADGVVIGDRILSGRYGDFFLANGKYVGLAKKQSTFEKKGYKMMLMTTEYKITFSGRTFRNNNPRFTTVEIVNQSVAEDLTPIYMSGMEDQILFCSTLQTA